MTDWWSACPVVSASSAGLDPRSRDYAIRTVFGEAGAEPDEGQAAVAAVIRNRVDAGRYGGKTVPDVVLAKNQFEPWGNDASRARMMQLASNDPQYQKIGSIVDRVFSGDLPDPTGGMTHFVSPSAQAALGRPMPSWAQGDALPIGRHTFYAPEGRVGSGNNWWSNSPLAEQPSPTSGGQFMAPLPDGGNARVAREGMSPPVATAGEAALSGFDRGGSFNFGDEIKGVLAAGGMAPTDPTLADRARSAVNALSGPAGFANRVPEMTAFAKGLYGLVTGDPNAQAAYRVATSQEREKSQRQQEQQPAASMAGEIVGASALPVGEVAAGANLGARMLAGLRAGGIVGGLSGLGEGTDLADRAIKGGIGAVVGGATGAAAPVAVEGVARGARAVMAPVANTIRGLANPDAEAARRVTTAIQRDIVSDPAAATRLTPQEFAASAQNGGPARIMDLGGETTRALARSAANTSPEGRAALNQAVDTRFEGQSQRVTDWLNRTFNFPDAAAQQRALETAQRQTNNAAYNRAYREGAQGLWSPELERLAGSDAVTGAMQRAASNARDEAIVSGYGAMNPRITFSPSGQIQFNRGPNGVPTYPDLQYWDLVRRELSDAAQRAGRGTSEARRLNNFATALNAELDRLVPSYQQARQGAASFFGAENALEAGQNFVAQRFANDEARQALSRMSPTERQLFQDGFVSRYVQTLNATPDRRSIVNNFVNSPETREKMRIALGPQGAGELEAGMRAERIMDFARRALQGNSTTTRQLQELGLAGGAYTVSSGFNPFNPDPTALMTAGLVYGAARGRNAINENLARRVAELLASDNPRQLARGAAVVSRSQNLLNSLRRFDIALSRGGGQQLPDNVPSLQ